MFYFLFFLNGGWHTALKTEKTFLCSHVDMSNAWIRTPLKRCIGKWRQANNLNIGHLFFLSFSTLVGKWFRKADRQNNVRSSVLTRVANVHKRVLVWAEISGSWGWSCWPSWWFDSNKKWNKHECLSTEIRCTVRYWRLGCALCCQRYWNSHKCSDKRPLELHDLNMLEVITLFGFL